jgi:DNA transformation protein
MPSNKNAFAEYVVTDLLSDLKNVRSRAMFGGYGIYKDSVMFGLIAYDELYFKVTEDNLSDYELAGSHPFVYTGHKKPITMSYWLVPPDVLEDSSTIVEWANKAYQAARKNKKV